jgi:type II secretory pathway component PulF
MLRRTSGARLLALGQRLEQLAELLDGGTPVATAASTIAVAERDAELRRRLCRFAARLEQGAPLAEAMSALELGELPGDLDARLALRHCGRHLRRRSELRAAWRNALAYPLACLAGLYGLFLLTRATIWPAIESYYIAIGVGSLPETMQTLLQLARWDWYVLPLSLGLWAWLLPGTLRRLALWTPLLGGALRRLLLADLLEGAALRMHLGTSAGHAADQAHQDLAWAAKPPLPRRNTEPGWLDRHLPVFGLVVPSPATLRRWRHTLANLGALPRPQQRPPSLEACLVRWRRGVEALPLLAAAQRGDAPEVLATIAERAAHDLRGQAGARIAMLGPVLAVLVALGLLWLTKLVASPVFSSGLLGGSW